MSQKGLGVFVVGRALAQHIQSPEPELQLYANETSTNLKRRLSALCPPSGQKHWSYAPFGMLLWQQSRHGSAKGTWSPGKEEGGLGAAEATAGRWHLLSVLVALKPQMHLVGGCSGNADGVQLPSTAACQSQSRIASCPSPTLRTLLLLLLSSQVGF